MKCTISYSALLCAITKRFLESVLLKRHVLLLHAANIVVNIVIMDIYIFLNGGLLPSDTALYNGQCCWPFYYRATDRRPALPLMKMRTISHPWLIRGSNPSSMVWKKAASLPATPSSAS